ncbi:MAG: DNA processing protein [Flavobacteriaceae bacterium]|jgi:DNA processing protein
MNIEKISQNFFPPLLREIPDLPEHIYVKGTLPSQEIYTYLTIVGSRKCTTYGKEVVKKCIENLRGLPVCIVSGLALGIDTIAHRTALEVGLPTISIPGSGIGEDVIYPRTNLSLAREIVEKGGALLSEYEPDFKATQWSFPKRNRIMAGISHTTLVIEAEGKSGTLITSRLANEYNRDVIAVPGSIFSQTSHGTNALISDGATPLLSPSDLPLLLGFKNETEQKMLPLEILTDHEVHIIKLLSEPLSRSELMRLSPLSHSETIVSITSLELKEYIVESAGKIQKIR